MYVYGKQKQATVYPKIEILEVDEVNIEIDIIWELISYGCDVLPKG